MTEVCIEFNAPHWETCIDYRDTVEARATQLGWEAHSFGTYLGAESPVVDLQWTVEDSIDRVADFIALLRAEFDVRNVFIHTDEELDA